jgi:two-component system sensor histidine kinase HupT/HoxJ
MRKPAGRPPADGGVGSPGAGSNSLPRPLMRQAGVDTMVALGGVGEEAWIEVIQKMDAVYADLVHHQVELEHKNSALEDAQRFIGSVLSAMTDALIVCDRNGRIERVNAAVERMTGRAEAELLGVAVSSLFDATGVLTMERLSDKLRTAGAAPAEAEVSLVDSHGNTTLLSVNCSARCDHRGVTVGHVLIGRPIGELKRAYESLNVAHRELRQAQQQLVVSEKMAALGRLVAGVAHELNNPISFVFGNMHALKRYGERLKAYLEAIDRGADAASLHMLRGRLKIDRVLSDITPLVEGTLEGAERVSEIVQDLRRFSSTQSEPAEPFDLIKVVRTAVSWVIKASKVKPEVVFDTPESLEVTGRKGPVHQIVVNLVQNAVDVMAETAAPRLEISTRQEGRHIAVTVHDNGPGVAPGAMQRLFEPFYTTKKIGEGTGLGLYVSYGLAEEMGGTLDAANHQHGGAMFTLRLPLEERAHAG